MSAGTPEPDVVRPTNHARLRWTMRSGRLDQAVSAAWDEAVPIPRHGDIRAAEIRYHDATGTLLIRQNDRVTTVLQADFVDEEVRAAIAEVRQDDG